MPYLPRHADGVFSHRLGAEVLVTRLGSDDRLLLTGLVADVWELCTGQVSRGVAAEALGLSASELEAHLAQFAEAGLLTPERYAPRTPAASARVVAGPAAAAPRTLPALQWAHAS